MGHHGGTIHHPRFYGAFATIGFLGRRREVYNRLAARSGIRPGDRVLDVGCGTGYWTRLLSPVAGPHGRVIGIDPSPEMVAHARRRAPDNCDYLVGEGQKPEFDDGSFDLVVASLAVHHIPEDVREQALREFHRVLKPGGKLLVAEFRAAEEWLPALVQSAGFVIRDEDRVPVRLCYVAADRLT